VRGECGEAGGGRQGEQGEGRHWLETSDGAWADGDGRRDLEGVLPGYQGVAAVRGPLASSAASTASGHPGQGRDRGAAARLPWIVTSLQDSATYDFEKSGLRDLRKKLNSAAPGAASRCSEGR
jgi:hypothetical protein